MEGCALLTLLRTVDLLRKKLTVLFSFDFDCQIYFTTCFACASCHAVGLGNSCLCVGVCVCVYGSVPVCLSVCAFHRANEGTTFAVNIFSTLNTLPYVSMLCASVYN